MAPIPPHDTIVPSTFEPVTREAEWIEQVDLSPDGKWLAYDSDRNGHQEIYKTRIEGGAPVRLTFDSAAGFAPAWSPDGREIAYHSFASGVRQIHVMSVDGTDNRAVTEDSVNKIRPSWSPDGRSLAFNCRWSLNRERACVATRGTNQKWAWRALPTEGATARTPRWSHDGRWIAYLVGPLDSKDVNQVWLLPTRGGAARRLVGGSELGGRVTYYQWGADPSVVFVQANYERSGEDGPHHSSGAYSIWSVPVTGGKPRRILTLPEPAGFGFATDGRRLFFPRVAEEGDVGMLSLRSSQPKD
jgi:Tol biopolymer transport system component